MRGSSKSRRFRRGRIGTIIPILVTASGFAAVAAVPGPVGAWATTGVTVAGANLFGGSGANELNAPQAVAVDGAGNVYVADTANNRVQRFPSGSTALTNGVTVAGGNGSGSNANQLSLPSAVLVDAKANVYVVDMGNNRIQRFPSGSTSATSGTTIAGGNGGGSAANQLASPLGLARDSAGNLYVADAKNNRVQKFPSTSTSATNGTTVAGGNGAGAGANQLFGPSGVGVDAAGNLFVSDNGNNRVQKFPSSSTSATNGVTVAGGNGSGANADQLSAPGGIGLDGSGNLYVTDTLNSRVQKFPVGSTSTTSAITVAGGNGVGSNANQLNTPLGLALDSKGNVYVADTRNSRVQKWLGTPDAPAITSSTYLTNTSASIRFVTRDGGGTPITSYTVTCVPKTGPTVTVTGTASPVTVTGLMAGEAYSCVVTANNAAGTSAPSDPALIVPGTPGPPAAPAVVRDGFQSVQLTATAPVNDGGSPITQYKFYAAGSPATLACTAVVPATGCRFTAMQAGVAFKFFVKAVNAIGDGAPSPNSTAVTGVTQSPFWTSGTAISSTTVILTPVSPAQTGSKVPVGARMIMYLTADTTASSAPTISVVSFPNGGAATCTTSYTAVTGGSATVGSGIRGAVISCVVTTAILNGATVRINLSSAPPRAVAMGEWYTGFTNGGTFTTTTAVTGVATAPGSGTTASVAPGALVVGAISYENGTLALAGDTDTVGGTPWGPVTSHADGSAGAAGVSVMRQVKWPTGATTHRYDSATVLGAGENWAGFILTIA